MQTRYQRKACYEGCHEKALEYSSSTSVVPDYEGETLDLRLLITGLFRRSRVAGFPQWRRQDHRHLSAVLGVRLTVEPQ